MNRFLPRLAFRASSLASAVLLAAAVAAPAASKSTTKPTKASKSAASQPADEWAAPMDYGPFLQTSVARAGGKALKTESFQSATVPKFPIDVVPDMVAAKGVVIPLGKNGPDGKPAATVCFDTDTLAMSGWTDGWVDLGGSMFTNHKGTSQVTLSGKERFRTDGVGPAAEAAGTDFGDPRPGKVGPLPADRGRWNGLYLNGDQVALSYRVRSVEVLEQPGVEWPTDGPPLFVRTFAFAKGGEDVVLSLATIDGGKASLSADGAATAILKPGSDVTGIRLAVGSSNARLVLGPEGRVAVRLGASTGAGTAKVMFWQGTIADYSKFDVAARSAAGPIDLSPMTKGGPSRWKPISVAGKLATAPVSAKASKKPVDPGFAVDVIPPPEHNAYNAWMRFTGVDFFSDGRAAVSTINGDVWVVSGLDDKLDHVTWTRFATGLYQPMGLKIVDDKVYVRGRDQITRLHDLNGDGEADFYENFNNEGVTHPSYHGFVFDLQTDAEGNFYYARGGMGMEPDLAGHGSLTKLSKDGKTATPIASGLRAPNGLGAGPQKWVLVSDNQGNWIPSSKISLVDPAGPPPFLGYLPHHHQPTLPATEADPLLWVPYKMDNSSGGQCYVDGSAWADFKGQWIHTSFGAACAMVILPDAATPAGQAPKQAAVVRLPLDFPTGVMRPRFNPKDGQLYLVGVGGGWQTKGPADGGFYRVRRTAKPTYVPTSFAVVPGGVKLGFAAPLDKTEAADVQNYAVEQWNYKWTEKYGSPDFSVKNPAKAGHDEVEVTAAELSADGRTITLKLGGLARVDQMMIRCNLKGADGTEFEQEVYATINAVPAGK